MHWSARASSYVYRPHVIELQCISFHTFLCNGDGDEPPLTNTIDSKIILYNYIQYNIFNSYIRIIPWLYPEWVLTMCTVGNLIVQYYFWGKYISYLFTPQNLFSHIKEILIDGHTKIWTEMTDIAVFRRKRLKFLQCVSCNCGQYFHFNSTYDLMHRLCFWLSL